MDNSCEIIITDDDADDRELLIQALKRGCYRGIYQHAENGRVLMELLQEKTASRIGNPDLIILDLNMPLMSGFEALNKMKNEPALNNIPVVVFTSSSQSDDETKCRELGCLQYFIKPFTLAEYDEIASEMLSIVRTKKPLC